MTKTEKFFFGFFVLVGVALIVPHLLLPLAEAAETKAYIASWSAGAIALIAACLAMRRWLNLSQIIAAGVVVVALCYIDHINHQVYLEEKEAAAAASK